MTTAQVYRDAAILFFLIAVSLTVGLSTWNITQRVEYEVVISEWEEWAATMSQLCTQQQGFPDLFQQQGDK